MEFLSKSCRLRNPQDFSKATIETGIRRTTEPAGLRVGKFWIFWCTWTVASGWLLSALHQTTVTGYFASYLAFAGVVWFFHKPIFGAAVRFPRLHWRYRFRRFLPRCFLLISLFCLLGGAINNANNVDYLTYRLPRMLHWAAERGWHWIETPDIRLNLSAQGMEWLMMPLMLFTRSDRVFFGLNFLSYLLMPSLTYRFLVDLGIRKKVAWQWMWLFPTGYCYVLQAGGLGNDAIAVPFFLCSVIFGIAARRSGSFRWLAFSVLAAGLLTSIKASNAPLVLPLLLVWLPSWRLAARNPVTTAGILLLLGLCSAFPTFLLNKRFTGSWTGDPGNSLQLQLANPLACFVGNNLQVLQSALHFPVFPLAPFWNRHVVMPAIASPPGAWLTTYFPRIALQWPEFEWEEPAGIGFSVGLLLATLVGLGTVARVRGAHFTVNLFGRLVLLGGLIAYLYYCVSLGSEQAGRLLAPYYPVLLLLVLWWCGSSHPIGQKWWQWLVRGTMVLPVFLVIIYPGHPVLGLDAILGKVPLPGGQYLRSTICGSYYRHAVLADGLSQVRAALPSNAQEIGLLGYYGCTQVSLWRPFGSRRIVQIYDALNPQRLPEWLVVYDPGLKQAGLPSPGAWARRLQLEKISTTMITLDDRIGPEPWSIYRRVGSTRTP
jgi:hypothetical protein